MLEPAQTGGQRPKPADEVRPGIRYIGLGFFGSSFTQVKSMDEHFLKLLFIYLFIYLFVQPAVDADSPRFSLL